MSAVGRRAPSRAPRRARLLLAAVVALVLVALTGCQLDVRVDTVVEEDGSGTVTVAVGLDEEALARVGDPDATFQVDDLRAAGWLVRPAQRDASGITWVEATKSFARPEDAAAVLGEVTGADGPLRDVAVRRESSVARNSWSFAGTVDLREGLAAFADDDLAAALGGDPFGGNLAAIESATGRPAGDQVNVTLTVDLPHADPKTFHPTFADAQPTSLATESSQLLPVPFIGGGGSSVLGVVLLAAAGTALVVALVALRRRFVSGR